MLVKADKMPLYDFRRNANRPFEVAERAMELRYLGEISLNNIFPMPFAPWDDKGCWRILRKGC